MPDAAHHMATEVRSKERDRSSRIDGLQHLLRHRRRHRAQGRRRRDVLDPARARRSASSVSRVRARASRRSRSCSSSPCRRGKFEGGRILFRGENLLEASEERMREIRGNDIAMIFQEPMTALNPVYTVGNQIMRDREAAPGTRRRTRRARARSRCCARSGSPPRRSAWTSTRTSSRGACASAS